MDKEIVFTDKAPAAIGPYSQGIKKGGMIFVSGQLPLDTKTGELEINDIKKATRNCIENLKAILEAGGACLGCVVKTTVFITDMAFFTDMNEIYSSYFNENPPARSCIQVAGLPKGVNVEIEAIAIVEK